MSYNKTFQFTKFDSIEGYKILNTIQPKYFQTRFPYDAIDSGRITFTQKKIEILAKLADDKVEMMSDRTGTGNGNGNGTGNGLSKKSARSPKMNKSSSKKDSKKGGALPTLTIYM